MSQQPENTASFDDIGMALNATRILNNGQNNTTGLIQEVSPTVYKIAAIYLGAITFCGISFNVIVICIVVNDRKLLTPMNLILLNQACSDLGIAVFGNPVAYLNANNENWIFSQQYCVIYGFLMSLFGICSIFTLSVLAYERYNIICHPFTAVGAHLSMSYATWSIVGTWAGSALVSAPPLFGWGSYQREAANISCSINWQSRDPNATSYIMFLFFIALGLPVCVIMFSYYKIWSTLRHARNMRRGTSNALRTVRRETHVARMVLLMVAAFFVAWGPYAVFSLIIALSDIELSQTLQIMPCLFAKSSVCYNPIIYFYLNKQFRRSCCERLGIRWEQEESSEEVRHLNLNRIKPPTPSRQADGEQVIPTTLATSSSICSSSSHFSEVARSDYKNRDIRISEPAPYNTLPFVRRKTILKSRSLPNLC